MTWIRFPVTPFYQAMNIDILYVYIHMIIYLVIVNYLAPTVDASGSPTTATTATSGATCFAQATFFGRDAPLRGAIHREKLGIAEWSSCSGGRSGESGLTRGFGRVGFCVNSSAILSVVGGCTHISCSIPYIFIFYESIDSICRSAHILNI